MVLFGQHPVGGADLFGGAAAVETEGRVMIGFSRVQFPESLGRSGRALVLARGQNLFCGRQQMCAFEQAAKIFFAGDLRGPFLRGQADHGFIFHLQALQAHDADIVLALFPGLALAEFHEWENDKKKSVSPDMTPKETAVSRRLLLLGSYLFLGSGFRRGLRGFSFWFCGHSFIFIYRFTCRRHD